MKEERRLLKTLGKNVLIYRKKKRWSQMDLAAEIDVDRAYIGTIERAEANPTLKKVARLAKALGIHPADLLDDR
ncbi:MAG: helix-turn-helix domain-containing protein [Candidatus Obscuribacterales bacterium]|jgi:transcriptional regulator with XRE-family HTH domain|nr:helix-turn-helix domain-containing protein [Candidatus Obscuribacterales bacterium]